MTIINKIRAVYFSPTGTTRKIVTATAKGLSRTLKTDLEEYDFTLPKARTQPLQFTDSDLVVFGTPVYAGRVPNVLLPYLNTMQGYGALAVPVVLFGNRDYDDALIELRDILENKGLHTIAAGAFVGEHSFSRILAKDRPDMKDMDIVVNSFAKSVKSTRQTRYHTPFRFPEPPTLPGILHTSVTGKAPPVRHP